jgi:hypothetical protein
MVKEQKGIIEVGTAGAKRTAQEHTSAINHVLWLDNLLNFARGVPHTHKFSFSRKQSLKRWMLDTIEILLV